jgi:hypothetical protein
MKSYVIKAANEAGRWRYIGIFAHPIDAALHAIDQGATRVSVKPIKPTPATTL